jgi:hypothetical protein
MKIVQHIQTKDESVGQLQKENIIVVKMRHRRFLKSYIFVKTTAIFLKHI